MYIIVKNKLNTTHFDGNTATGVDTGEFNYVAH